MADSTQTDSVIHCKGCCVHPGICLLQIAIPVMSVTNIKKTKTAILVPNALVIATANDRVRGPTDTLWPLINVN